MDNRQALGYMLLACKQLGYSKEKARKLLGQMYYMFDIKTEDEAEEQGFEWYRSLEEPEHGDNTPFISNNDAKPRKITRFPKGNQTKLSNESIRPYTKVNLSFPVLKHIDNVLDKIDKRRER